MLILGATRKETPSLGQLFMTSQFSTEVFLSRSTFQWSLDNSATGSNNFGLSWTTTNCFLSDHFKILTIFPPMSFLGDNILYYALATHLTHRHIMEKCPVTFCKDSQMGSRIHLWRLNLFIICDFLTESLAFDLMETYLLQQLWCILLLFHSHPPLTPNLCRWESPSTRD